MCPINAIDYYNQYQTKRRYKRYCAEDFDSIINTKKDSRQEHTANFFADMAKKSGIVQTQLPVEYLAGNYLVYKKPIPLSLIQKTAQYMGSEKKQILDDDLFFIRMNKYGKSKIWAHKMNGLTYILSYMVSSKKDFEEILKIASYQLRILNDDNPYFGKRRTKTHVFTIFENETNRGDEYFERYKNTCEEKSTRLYTPHSNREYKEADVCTIEYSKYMKSATIVHEKPVNNQKNISLAAQEYNKLISSDNPDIDEINHSIATIHWLIAQQMPYTRGSDSSANLLTKAIYHAYDVKITPAKEGHSFDFEAFYRNLDDFINIYPDLFEQKPQKILYN